MTRDQKLIDNWAFSRTPKSCRADLGSCLSEAADPRPSGLFPLALRFLFVPLRVALIVSLCGFLCLTPPFRVFLHAAHPALLIGLPQGHACPNHQLDKGLAAGRRRPSQAAAVLRSPAIPSPRPAVSLIPLHRGWPVCSSQPALGFLLGAVTASNVL